MSVQSHDANRNDAAQLRAHFKQCAFALGRLHRLRCMGEALDAFLAPRFVSVLTVMTTVVVVGASLGLTAFHEERTPPACLTPAQALALLDPIAGRRRSAPKSSASPASSSTPSLAQVHEAKAGASDPVLSAAAGQHRGVA
jgi:hypothetical protein